MQGRIDSLRSTADSVKAQLKTTSAALDEVSQPEQQRVCRQSHWSTLPLLLPTPLALLTHLPADPATPSTLLSLQANIALAKSQEEGQSFKGKYAEAKLQKDGLFREMEQLKTENAMIHADLRALIAEQPSAPLPSVIYAKWYTKSSAWPRVAFTARYGKCLHNRACGSIDTTKITTIDYASHRELEALIQEEGFVLCHSCRAEPGF